MDIEHFRNQAHALWLEEYKQYAFSVLREGFGEGTYDAVILVPDQKDLLDADLIPQEPPYKSVATIKLPAGSIQVFIALARFAHIMIQFPVVINGVNFKTLPPYTFSLPALLQASFPRDVKNGKFTNTTGGMMVGLTQDVDNGDVGLHCALAGLGVLLMEECRKEISPFATDEDLIQLTENMFLSFLVSEIRMDR